MRNSELQQGFTLVELLIVLTILGAVSAFAAPNLWSSLQRASEQRTVLSYGSEIQNMRRELFFTGKAVLVDRDSLGKDAALTAMPVPPAGWNVVENSPLSFLPSGVAAGGFIRFESPTGRIWKLTITSLDGRISAEVTP